MEEGEPKFLKVIYEVIETFKIPKNINLEDKRQVIRYRVEKNILYVDLVSGSTLSIQPVGGVKELDFDCVHKDVEIVGAEEDGCFDSEELESWPTLSDYNDENAEKRIK